MSLALYIKQSPEKAFANKIRKKKRDRFFAVSILLVGFSSIIFAAWPLLVWNFEIIPKLASKIENVPIPDVKVLSVKTSLGNDVQIASDPDGFSYFTTSYKPNQKRPEEFYLTVPKLKIENARVIFWPFWVKKIPSNKNKIKVISNVQ